MLLNYTKECISWQKILLYMKFALITDFNISYDKTRKGKDNDENILNKVSEYRDERVKYHMEQMKEILYKYLEAEKEKQIRA